jgi:hypothetical protein
MTADQYIEIVKAVGRDLIHWVAICVIIFWFRSEITRALSGLGSVISSLSKRRIAVGDVSLDAPSAPATQLPAKGPETVVGGPALPPTADPVIAEAETYVTERLNNQPEEQRLQVATRDAAELLIIAVRFRIYALIYGSQLTLLKVANTTGSHGVPPDVAQKIFHEAKARDEAFFARYTFENWTGFLLEPKLIEMSGQNVVITMRGRGFLRWIVDSGLTDSGVGNNAAH